MNTRAALLTGSTQFRAFDRVQGGWFKTLFCAGPPPHGWGDAGDGEPAIRPGTGVF